MKWVSIAIIEAVNSISWPPAMHWKDSIQLMPNRHVLDCKSLTEAIDGMSQGFPSFIEKENKCRFDNVMIMKSLLFTVTGCVCDIFHKQKWPIWITNNSNYPLAIMVSIWPSVKVQIVTQCQCHHQWLPDNPVHWLIPIISLCIESWAFHEVKHSNTPA